MKKEQIEILEEAFELLEEYPDQLDDRYANGGWYRCAICHGLIGGGGGHKEKCRLVLTRLKLEELIQELKKND